jgi:hypothetical protein
MFKSLIVANSFFALTVFAAEELSFQERYLKVDHAILCKENSHPLCQQAPTSENLVAIELDMGTKRYNEILALELVPGTPMMGLIEEICTPKDVATFQDFAKQIVRDPSALDEIQKLDAFTLISRPCLEKLSKPRKTEITTPDL